MGKCEKEKFKPYPKFLHTKDKKLFFDTEKETESNTSFFISVKTVSILFITCFGF